MLTKISALVSSKVALAALGGLLLIGGGGTAALAATGQMPTDMALLTSLRGHHTDNHGHANNSQGDTQNAHAHTVAVQGTLQAYDATHHAILVAGKAEDNDTNKGNTKPTCSLTSPFTIALNGSTKINGRAKSEGELASAIGKKVEVQASETSNCALLATKVTVSASDKAEHVYTGTVVGTVGASSFTLQPAHGSTITVTVTSSTRFEGAVRSLAELKTGMHIVVHGTAVSTGTVQAIRITGGGRGHGHGH